MSSSKSPLTICIPAHILDANISPRSREMLMLLASQTTEENPTLWVCNAAIAEKLRCSPVTISIHQTGFRSHHTGVSVDSFQLP